MNAPANDKDNDRDPEANPIGNGPRHRVAVLGGGMGALTAALYLTQGQNRDRYEVTVYQRGWRLGGKGASGRNSDHDDRIEEHGLHIWLGFYENAFHLYREVFAEWRRPAGHPWKSWNDGAFKKFNFTPLFEKMADGTWDQWNIRLPENGRLPGGGEKFSLRGLLRDIRKMLGDLTSAARNHAEKPLPPEAGSLAALLGSVDLDALRVAFDPAHGMAIDPLLRELDHFVGAPWDVGRRTVVGEARIENFARMCEALLQNVQNRHSGVLDDLRKLLLIVEFALVVLIGLLRNFWAILTGSLDVLDDMEFRIFLRKYGASVALLAGPLVGAWYDLVFAYKAGNTSPGPRPTSDPGAAEAPPPAADCAAGVSVRGIYRLALTYKGAVFWKMQAGMGDTIFTPIYRVLEARQVRFRFFHDVKELVLSPDGKNVAEVRMEQQATPTGPDGDYHPLVEVKGLECWPSAPLYWQLQEQAELRRGGELPDGGYDLESDFTEWGRDGQLEEITLGYGADNDYGFDHLVFGLAVGSVAATCPQLLAIDPNMRAMTEAVKTVRTQAYQMWLNRDLQGVGWMDAPPVATHFDNPLNTWADMTHLGKFEGSPAGGEAQQIAYFCGPLEDDAPPDNIGDLFGEVRTRVRHNSLGLQRSLLGIWPLAADQGGQFDPAIIDGDYVRGNVSGSERYVLSVSGSTGFRLRADGTAFSNLYLAGDWTRNNFNAGCIEAAAMSGMQAAHAISSYPPLDDIYGNEGP